MKKFFIALMMVLAISAAGINHKINQYYKTNLPGNTVVYYSSSDIYLHTDINCRHLKSGLRIEKNTYGKMKLSTMHDGGLCRYCTPPQYIH